MFSNLSKGSVLYGLDRRDKIKWFTASIEKVTPGMSKTTPNMFGQFPELRLDIIANINGEQKEFQQVPGNNAIADFGEKSFDGDATRAKIPFRAEKSSIFAP